MSVSFDISFSRTREVKVLFFHICILKTGNSLLMASIVPLTQFSRRGVDRMANCLARYDQFDPSVLLPARGVIV